MMRHALVLMVLLAACGRNPVAVADFAVDVSLTTSPLTLVTPSGRTDGCQATWTFRANDPSPTVYYSLGPGMTANASEWWENGDFRGGAAVSAFVPAGRAVSYNLHRVNGTTETWRKDSGSIQPC